MWQHATAAVGQYRQAEPVMFWIFAGILVLALMLVAMILFAREQYNKRQRFRNYFRKADPENPDSQPVVREVLEDERGQLVTLKNELTVLLAAIEVKDAQIRGHRRRLRRREHSARDFGFRIKKPTASTEAG